MKRFYNNKLMRFAPKGALRFVALLCVLLGFCSSAWAETCYIDATEIINDGYTVNIDMFMRQQANNNIDYSKISDGVWTYEYENINTKIKFKLSKDGNDKYPLKEPVKPRTNSSHNCIKFTYDGNNLEYTWIKRDPYMGDRKSVV